jgi:hypothetical protein
VQLGPVLAGAEGVVRDVAEGNSEPDLRMSMSDHGEPTGADDLCTLSRLMARELRIGEVRAEAPLARRGRNKALSQFE